MPGGHQAALAAILLAATALSGCLDGGVGAAWHHEASLQATIALPRLGDWAAYRSTYTTDGGSWQTTTEYQIVQGASTHALLTNGQPSFRLHSKPYGVRDPPVLDEVAVDASTNAAIGSARGCAVTLADVGCLWSLVAVDRSIQGMPWLHGASIFQGRVLGPDAGFRVDFPVYHNLERVEYHVKDAAARPGMVAFRVVGVADAVAPPTTGTWTLLSSIPYPVIYEYDHVVSTPAGDSTLHVAHQLIAWTRGAGAPLDVGPARPLAWRAADAIQAWPAGMPAGSSAPLGTQGSSLRSAWQELLRQVPEAVPSRATTHVERALAALEQSASGQWVVSARPEDRESLRTEFEVVHAAQVRAWTLQRECQFLLNPATRACQWSAADPVAAGAWQPADRRLTASIDFGSAWGHANSTLPRDAVAVEMAMLRTSHSTAEQRVAFPAFTFFYPSDAGTAGHVRLKLGVRVDGVTGGILAAIVEVAVPDGPAPSDARFAGWPAPSASWPALVRA